MDKFCQELVRIRLELNHSTTKSFFNYLKSRGLDCNYQYFVKISTGLIFPTHMLVNQIIKSLSINHAELLVKSYCSMQFQKFDYLFQKSFEYPPAENVKEVEVHQGQKTLSILQVSMLAKNKENYFLFLILTLSRKGLDLIDLKKMNKKFQVAINDLTKSEIAFVENNFLYSASNEFKFPKESSDGLSQFYKKFDEWDLLFGEEFDFKNVINKMMIRRISPRYLSLITKQIELLSDQIRMSDESERQHNSEVLQIQIRLKSGKIIG